MCKKPVIEKANKIATEKMNNRYPDGWLIEDFAFKTFEIAEEFKELYFKARNKIIIEKNGLDEQLLVEDSEQRMKLLIEAVANYENMYFMLPDWDQLHRHIFHSYDLNLKLTTKEFTQALQEF